MTKFEVWVHPKLAAEFAVRIEDGQVTGVTGISLDDQAEPDRWPALDYDTSPAALYRFQEHPEQFFYLGGRRVPKRRPRR